MATHDLVKIFDQTKIRVVWDDEKEKYHFSVMDVVQVLTDQPERRTAAKYWSVVKTREYKHHKGLTSQNLRDNMTNMELLLNALAEQTDIPQNMIDAIEKTRVYL